MSKTDNKPQNQHDAKLPFITHALLFPYLPKWAQNSLKVSGLIEEEILIAEIKLGKEKTRELIVQFKNEAYTQAEANSDYIIRKLRAARHGL